MLFARAVLVIQLLALAGLGLAYFVRPHEMANLSGMLLMSPAAATDMRAFYGGLQLGLAAFLGFGGLWLDGGAQQTFNLYALLLEVVSAGLSYWALRGLQRL